MRTVEEKTVDRVVDAGRVSPKGRPEGEHRSAQREGTPLSARGFRGNESRWTIVAIAMSLVGCATAPAPAPQIDARPVQPAPIIIVQPVQPEPPPPVVVAPPEPPKINEEAEEALAVLADLQKLALAGPDEQKRELAAATQAVARQKSDAARLKLGMLQSLPAGGGDEARALATLDPVLRQGNGPTRMVAAVLMVQLNERQRVVREEKRKSEDLQQKLDALKALERSLLGRERKPANSP